MKTYKHKRHEAIAKEQQNGNGKRFYTIHQGDNESGSAPAELIEDSEDWIIEQVESKFKPGTWWWSFLGDFCEIFRVKEIVDERVVCSEVWFYHSNYNTRSDIKIYDVGINSECAKNATPATPEQIERYLSEETERRGYNRPGIRIFGFEGNLNVIEPMLGRKYPFYDPRYDLLWVMSQDKSVLTCVYARGQWADIIELKKKEEDIGADKCLRCEAIGTPSKAFVNTHNLRGKPEFETKYIDCKKCPKCGKSWVSDEFVHEPSGRMKEFHNIQTQANEPERYRFAGFEGWVVPESQIDGWVRAHGTPSNLVKEEIPETAHVGPEPYVPHEIEWKDADLSQLPDDIRTLPWLTKFGDAHQFQLDLWAKMVENDSIPVIPYGSKYRLEGVNSVFTHQAHIDKEVD